MDIRKSLPNPKDGETMVAVVTDNCEMIVEYRNNHNEVTFAVLVATLKITAST